MEEVVEVYCFYSWVDLVVEDIVELVEGDLLA